MIMKPMKFFNSKKDQFSKKKTSKKTLKVKYIYFLEKVLKLISLFEKVVLIGVLKNYMKKVNPRSRNMST